jgi:hypothetical protein
VAKGEAGISADDRVDRFMSLMQLGKMPVLRNIIRIQTILAAKMALPCGTMPGIFRLTRGFQRVPCAHFRFGKRLETTTIVLPSSVMQGPARTSALVSGLKPSEEGQNNPGLNLRALPLW